MANYKLKTYETTNDLEITGLENDDGTQITTTKINENGEIAGTITNLPDGSETTGGNANFTQVSGVGENLENLDTGKVWFKFINDGSSSSMEAYLYNNFYKIPHFKTTTTNNWYELNYNYNQKFIEVENNVTAYLHANSTQRQQILFVVSLDGTTITWDSINKKVQLQPNILTTVTQDHTSILNLPNNYLQKNESIIELNGIAGNSNTKLTSEIPDSKTITCITFESEAGGQITPTINWYKQDGVYKFNIYNPNDDATSDGQFKLHIFTNDPENIQKLDKEWYKK